MPDEPETTHVEVADVGVECDFKVKNAAALTKLATTAVAKTIDAKAKYLTTGKGVDGYYVNGHITIASKESGKAVVLEGTAKFQIATWPKKAMFAFPTGTAKVSATPDDLEGYAGDLAKALAASITEKQVVTTLDKKVAESAKKK